MDKTKLLKAKYTMSYVARISSNFLFHQLSPNPNTTRDHYFPFNYMNHQSKKDYGENWENRTIAGWIYKKVLLCLFIGVFTLYIWAFSSVLGQEPERVENFTQVFSEITNVFNSGIIFLNLWPIVSLYLFSLLMFSNLPERTTTKHLFLSIPSQSKCRGPFWECHRNQPHTHVLLVQLLCMYT